MQPLTIISISTDRKIFEAGSDVRKRMIEYGAIFSELHIIVFSKKSLGYTQQKIAENVWVYPTNSSSKWLYVRDARRCISKIIVVQNINLKKAVVTSQDPFETGIVGTYISKKYHLPLQIQVHTDLFNPFFVSKNFLNRVRVRMARRILPKADEIRVVSARIKKSILDKIPAISEKRIDILPVFVADPALSVQSENVDLKKKYPAFGHIILIASRLEPEKNIDFALEVFRDVVARYPKAGLVIAGTGSQKSLLEKKAYKLGISQSVVFEPWPNNVASYYKTCDIFLMTSSYEGHSMALVEAGLSGAAIVTSDVGSARDFLEDGVSALFARVGDRDAFTKKICSVIADRNFQRTLQIKARESFKNKLVLDKNEYLKKYAELAVKAFSKTF